MFPNCLYMKPLGRLDPFRTALSLRTHNHLLFLDSATQKEGEWSYLALGSGTRFQVKGGRAFIDGIEQAGQPLDILRPILKPKAPFRQDGPPFQGGVIGFVSYEAARLFDSVQLQGHDEVWPQMDFAVVETFIAFHHSSNEAYALSCAENGQEAVEELLALRCEPKLSAFTPPLWAPCESQSSYENKVQGIKNWILDGDIFQANLSQRFTAPGCDPYALYNALRTNNAASYAALWVEGERFIASASPELFLSLRGGTVTTRPIKGTCSRGGNPQEDEALAKALLASTKDRAENIMIVDLLRNDLSRIADPFSVEVPKLCALESQPHVHHLVSTVTARLAEGKDALDVLKACFPGGSVTGAPKIRAMQIIDELEGESRGVYCGAFGWIGFNGDAEFSIPIRTITGDGVQMNLRAGGGVTLLSEAEAEYQESMAKAQSVMG